jgi:hypothetical protein
VARGDGDVLAADEVRHRDAVGEHPNQRAFAEILGQPARAEHSAGRVAAPGRIFAVPIGPQLAHHVHAAARARLRPAATRRRRATAREAAAEQRRDDQPVETLRELELALVEDHCLQAASGDGGSDGDSSVPGVDDAAERDLLGGAQRHEHP